MTDYRSSFLPLLVAMLALVPAASASDYDPQPFPQENPPIVQDAGNHAPRLVSAVDPVYPTDLVSRGWEDLVWVAFIVDQNGDVQKARAFFSRREVFEEAAVNAVRAWKFTPGAHLGHAVKTQMVVALKFAPR